MTLPSVASAARNNAMWCDAVCRSHGTAGVFGARAWTAPRRSPDLYPDAVTLDPLAGADELLAHIDAGPGCSVKDSFAALDLAPHGLRVLFEAEWIGLDEPEPQGARATRWQTVHGPAELDEWVAAWAAPDTDSPFRPELLDEPGVVMLAGDNDSRVVAGAILNYAAGVVGISNRFSSEADADSAWDAAITTAGARFPEASIVGYESGADLDAARRHGFVSLGPLRVWIRDER